MRIPAELFQYKQWVLWRKAEVNGRITKVPISPWTGKAAACDRPRTWSSYRHTRYTLSRHGCEGVGFVFTDNDPFCGIDLDDCCTVDGNIAPAAMHWIERFGSYAEFSPSGNGVHILIKGKLPERGRRAGKLEVYDRRRYFTMTANHVRQTPFAIHSRQDVLEQLISELFPVSAEPKLSERYVAEEPPLSDEELIERATAARNGERFKRLWAGEISDYDNDHSRADLALCSMLDFWCAGDPQRMDRLFRQSGLMREKWDRPTGGLAYGALTIKTASGRS